MTGDRLVLQVPVGTFIVLAPIVLPVVAGGVALIGSGVAK